MKAKYPAGGMFTMALIKAFGGKRPVLDRPAFVAETAVLIGDVHLAPDSSVFYGAVLRGDSGSIVIGEGSNIQDGAVLHTGEGEGVQIGRHVTVGHCAIVHGCTVEDDALIGMHATVMNGAVIGRGSIVAAGALVTEGTIVPPGSVVMGVPAKVRGSVSPELQAETRANTAGYVDCARAHAAEPALK